MPPVPPAYATDRTKIHVAQSVTEWPNLMQPTRNLILRVNLTFFHSFKVS
jgi:hypothetical protein